jgi:hypothetical protein
MNEFEREAKQADTSLVRELRYFLRQSRKWWLAPFLLAMLLFAGLLLLSSTAAAPFIYTLF